jgi:phosphatidylinositol alpha-1,6-mannosyltransferase
VRLACSRATVERFRRENPAAPHVETIHLALGEMNGTDSAAAVDTDARETVGEPYLLIVGRLAAGERYKGHDEVLAALSRLAPTHPRLRLVVAGDGDDRPRLEAAARELGVADRVRFTGFVTPDELDALYARCLALVMPSQGEGFGFVYLEAMRAARPCIALAGTAAAEIIVDGDTGMLIEPGVEALTRSIDELLRDPQLVTKMGTAGRKRWQREFVPERFAQQIGRELDRIVA